MLFKGGSYQNVEGGVAVVGEVDIITFTEMVVVVSGGQTKPHCWTTADLIFPD